MGKYEAKTTTASEKGRYRPDDGRLKATRIELVAAVAVA
jgi:hypothetical protein